MDNTLFQTLIDNQDFWRDLAIKQENKTAAIKKQERKEKNWYGN